MVKRLHKLFKEKGIDSIMFDGTINKNVRYDALENKFKNGDTPLVIATKKSMSEGLNLQVANFCLFFDNSFVPKEELQGIARMLRIGQEKDVDVEFLAYTGSIDDYQRQMVEHKSDAVFASLDYAEPRLDDAKFLHMETILSDFVNDLSEIKKKLLREPNIKIAS
jgi:SNF2 family DNA or RNA helicase